MARYAIAVEGLHLCARVTLVNVQSKRTVLAHSPVRMYQKPASYVKRNEKAGAVRLPHKCLLAVTAI
jgi:hypothetical protein